MTALIKLELELIQFNLRELCLAHRYEEFLKETIAVHCGIHLPTALRAARRCLTIVPNLQYIFTCVVR